MKFISQGCFKNFSRFLYKETVGERAETIAENPTNPVAEFAQENSEDVDSVLKNEQPKNFLRRLWDKTKSFFKGKILNLTEAGNEGLNNLSTGEIKAKYLYKTNDIFMLWACVETLAQRSDFVLRETHFLKTINRVSGQEIFAANDYKELSNEDLNKKFYDWVKNTPELGESKAELWKPNFFADNMVKADEDYEGEVKEYTETPEKFTELVGGYFEDFLSQDAETVATVDKGFVLAILRKSIQRRKMNEGIDGDVPLQFLVHGAAIGLISDKDIYRISKDFGGNMPLLTVFAEAKFEDFKKWSAELNGGEIPKENKEFSVINKNAWQKLYLEEWSQNKVFDSALYNGLIPNIQNADFKDMSLWAHKLNQKQLKELLQMTSDKAQKMTTSGWEELLKGFVVSAQKKSNNTQLLKNGLLLTETLMGNYQNSDRENTATLTDVNEKFKIYREELHELIKEKFPDLDLADKSSVQKFIDGDLEAETAPEEEVSELKTEELPIAA